MAEPVNTGLPMTGPAMTYAETIAMIEATPLSIRPAAGTAIRTDGAPDDPFGPGPIRRAARLLVAVWALAVNGDEAPLTGLSETERRYFLLHPAMERWIVAPSPAVTAIEVVRLSLDQDPPELAVDFEFTGRQLFTDETGQLDPVRAPGPETGFIGSLYLRPAGPDDAGSLPWLLDRGYVRTLDQFFGYVFTSRREGAEEYQQRTGATAEQTLAALTAPPPDPGRDRRFRIVAGFAEHDYRFGARASVEVVRDTPPSRTQAADLVWPAVDQVTEDALGPGDWRPSLNWVDLIELLG
jgi:hypothetical protein